MKQMLTLFLFVIGYCVVTSVTATSEGGDEPFFTIKPETLDNIRQIINKGNSELLNSVGPEVLDEIQKIIEDEINKFRHLGQKPEFAVDSCKDIRELQPCSPSGYYWLETHAGPLGVYCEMNPAEFNGTGGWMKVANIDMKRNSSVCPTGLNEVKVEGKRLCQRTSTTCSSAYFDVHEIEYKKVCGRITGYQFGTPQAFYSYSTRSVSRSKLILPSIVRFFQLLYPTFPRIF